MNRRGFFQTVAAGVFGFLLRDTELLKKPEPEQGIIITLEIAIGADVVEGETFGMIGSDSLCAYVFDDEGNVISSWNGDHE